MSKSKKPRNKAYRPKPVAQHGGLVAIAMCHARGENASVLKDDQITDLGVAYWLSFENLRTGDANEEAWSCVACALNVALVLTEKGIGAEYEGALVKALDGTFRAKTRSAKTGNFRLDGEAMRDIEIALQVHDQQMAIAKRWEVTEAMSAIYKRLAAGNAYQDASFSLSTVAGMHSLSVDSAPAGSVDVAARRSGAVSWVKEQVSEC